MGVHEDPVTSGYAPFIDEARRAGRAIMEEALSPTGEADVYHYELELTAEQHGLVERLRRSEMGWQDYPPTEGTVREYLQYLVTERTRAVRDEGKSVIGSLIVVNSKFRDGREDMASRSKGGAVNVLAVGEIKRTQEEILADGKPLRVELRIDLPSPGKVIPRVGEGLNIQLDWLDI